MLTSDQKGNIAEATIIAAAVNDAELARTIIPDDLADDFHSEELAAWLRVVLKMYRQGEGMTPA